MRRAEALIIFILTKVSRPLLSNHAIILDDLRWKNLIIMAMTKFTFFSAPKGQKLQSHYVIMLARAERATRRRRRRDGKTKIGHCE